MREEQKQLVLDNVNKEFTDKMWTYFGLSSHPGYSDVEIQPILSRAGIVSFEPPLFYVRDLLDKEEDLQFEACHENAHILHYVARKHSEQSPSQGIQGNLLLTEIIANYATMFYLENKDPIYPTGDLHENINYSQLLARDLLTCDEQLLRHICTVPVDKAGDIIQPYLKNPLDTDRDPYEITSA